MLRQSPGRGNDSDAWLPPSTGCGRAFSACLPLSCRATGGSAGYSVTKRFLLGNSRLSINDCVENTTLLPLYIDTPARTLKSWSVMVVRISLFSIKSITRINHHFSRFRWFNSTPLSLRGHLHWISVDSAAFGSCPGMYICLPLSLHLPDHAITLSWYIFYNGALSETGSLSSVPTSLL